MHGCPPLGACPNTHQSLSAPVPGIALASWCSITLGNEVIAHQTDEETIKSVANFSQKANDRCVFWLLLIWISLPT